jgi:hypothetical protein
MGGASRVVEDVSIWVFVGGLPCSAVCAWLESSGLGADYPGASAMQKKNELSSEELSSFFYARNVCTSRVCCGLQARN